ncbi:hypothetical protein VPHK406_0021 [Vibrio phage K406]
MTRQKLRKFKLIDREGYLDSAISNKDIYKNFFNNDITEGYINMVGDLGTEDQPCVIDRTEFNFFEEVFDNVEEDFIPTLNEVCEVSRADDLENWYKFIPRAKYTPHYLSEEQYVGDWQSEDVSWKVEQISAENFVFRPLQEQTWQEKLCEEYSEKNQIFRYLEYCEDSDLIKVEAYIEPAELIHFAKRILELSEGDK